MNRQRGFSVRLVVALLFLAGSLLAAEGTDLSEGRPSVRWRGFNLLGLFIKGASPGFYKEESFQMIHDWGFNFVRLPTDYRFWIKDRDWEQIDEEKVKAIDQAIAWGRQHNIHVQFAFHRAPGYTVARPPEAKNLFKDDDALRVCAKHWAFFAKRYKGIPSSALSFNLFNEPGNISEADYERVATALVAAIRQEDPSRFIIADGIGWGRRPAQSLFKLGIGQATRGYTPMSVTHYMASWVGTPREPPIWPPVPMAVSPLYGAGKKPWNVPLVLEDVPAGTLDVSPGSVSGRVTLRIEADGEMVSDLVLNPGEGPGWTNVVFRKEWNITQAKYTGSYTVKLQRPVKRLTLSIAEGDWAGLRKLVLSTSDGQRSELLFANEWGKTNAVFRFLGFKPSQGFQTSDGIRSGKEELTRTTITPWQPAFDAGIFVMAGEFGVYHCTPHEITLALMEDYLSIWKDHNIGWALWNFDGSFGILDSGREDVHYEDFNGHKLDRKMLELLQKY